MWSSAQISTSRKRISFKGTVAHTSVLIWYLKRPQLVSDLDKRNKTIFYSELSSSSYPLTLFHQARSYNVRLQCECGNSGNIDVLLRCETSEFSSSHLVQISVEGVCLLAANLSGCQSFNVELYMNPYSWFWVLLRAAGFPFFLFLRGKWLAAELISAWELTPCPQTLQIRAGLLPLFPPSGIHFVNELVFYICPLEKDLPTLY